MPGEWFARARVSGSPSAALIGRPGAESPAMATPLLDTNLYAPARRVSRVN
jgi:hypothetical protein